MSLDSELERQIQSNKRRVAAKEAMLALIDTTNTMGGESEVIAGMVEALGCTHRTLQQSFISCFIATMGSYADFNTDLRNEAAVEFAKKIKAMDCYMPLI